MLKQKQLIWHSDPNKFLVGSSDVRLYEYNHGNIQMIAVNSDVVHYKSLDWSPHQENVIVV